MGLSLRKPTRGDLNWDEPLNDNFRDIEQYVNQISGYDNIINGNFRFWQRGNTFNVVSWIVYGPDRWKMINSGGSATFTNDPAGIRISGVVGANRVGIQQEIEDLATLVGKTVTLSISLRTNRNYHAVIVVYNAIGTESHPGDVNIIADATTYKTYSATAYIPADAARLAIRVIDIDTSSVVSDVYISNVKLEVGSIATPFVSRMYEQELALCQRYYEKSYDIYTAPGSAVWSGGVQWQYAGNTISGLTAGIIRRNHRFAVTKRIEPTMTMYSSIGTANAISRVGGTQRTGVTFGSAGQGSSMNINIDNTSSQAINPTEELFYHWTADAEIY